MEWLYTSHYHNASDSLQRQRGRKSDKFEAAMLFFSARTKEELSYFGPLAPALADPNAYFYVCGLKPIEDGIVLPLRDVAQQAGLWTGPGNDRATGVIRHGDAAYAIAIECVRAKAGLAEFGRVRINRPSVGEHKVFTDFRSSHISSAILSCKQLKTES
jgi:hypothetical protein